MKKAHWLAQASQWHSESQRQGEATSWLPGPCVPLQCVRVWVQGGIAGRLSLTSQNQGIRRVGLCSGRIQFQVVQAVGCTQLRVAVGLRAPLPGSLAADGHSELLEASLWSLLLAIHVRASSNSSNPPMLRIPLNSPSEPSLLCLPPRLLAGNSHPLLRARVINGARPNNPLSISDP